MVSKCFGTNILSDIDMIFDCSGSLYDSFYSIVLFSSLFLIFSGKWGDELDISSKFTNSQGEYFTLSVREEQMNKHDSH